MKVLFVENFNLNKDNPMSSCYPLKCNKIINSGYFDFYDISTDFNLDITMYDKVLFGCRSVSYYKAYNTTNEKKEIYQKIKKLLPIKYKYFIIQDMHPKTYGDIFELCLFLNMNKINVIFTFLNNKEADIIKSLTNKCKHYHLLHHIDTSIFKNTNKDKEYDIILYGSIHPKHYPFRKRLFELILANQDKFKVLYLTQPDTFDPEKCEYGLADKINKSKIGIATKSIYDYLVGKYFEISCCNSIVAGDMATDGISIFNDNYIKLENSMSDDEIINKLISELNNYENNKDKIEQFNNMILDNFNLDKYIENLIKILI